MRVIGTAGHVDHGKSTLVEALTGTHPDRLKEEREREMTIDLGFAWLTLPNGEEVGVVDVPGHRDFIENMLAGVGGIDAVLFVVAADEGIMPQTREHLAILDLLQIPSGVVVLTKIELVGEGESTRSEWLSLVEDDLRLVLAGTVLANAPILRVSARTHEGIPALVDAIQVCLAESPPRPDLGRPRLPVDRVFTISGFGTVVTGTLTDGHVQVGDDILVLPSGLRGRIRGLQTHKKKEEIAIPGGRTAINISGIDLEQVHRGDVVARPGDYTTTRRLDVRVRLLKDASQPLLHNTPVKLFLRTAEVVARLRLLGEEELAPGEEGWLQLELNDPVIAVRGDRFILRRPSPGETLGGGLVVDAQPSGRHKRFDATVLSKLEALARGSPTEIILQSMTYLGAASMQEAVTRSHLDQQIAWQAVAELYQSGQIIDLEERMVEEDFEAGKTASLPAEAFVASKGFWEGLNARIIKELDAYHQMVPLRKGMPKEELKSRLKSYYKNQMTPRLFNALVQKMLAAGKLAESRSVVWLPGHAIQLSDQQTKQVEDLMKHFLSSPYAPPTVKECQAELGEELFNALLELDQLVFIPPDVVFRQADYQLMRNEVESLISNQGTITAAKVRDHFKTSRRYVLAFLEHLDALGITVREGDVRRLKNRK